MGGFWGWFRENSPPGCYGSILWERCPLTKVYYPWFEGANITNFNPGGGSFERWQCSKRALTPDHRFMAHQLKPYFCSFQRVQDLLYLQPPTMVEESSSTKAYFGALTFTKPLEKLVLCTVSIRLLLDWLSKPKGPHLVEATGGANPERALAIVVSRRMLYENETPLVGVGLVYKPHYISPEPFSTTYMCLNEWHKAGSQTESEDRITSSRLLFIGILDGSSMLPVALQHPILLDLASRKMLEASEELPAPAQLRGFKLHTIWNQQPEGELTRRVGFPRLFGENSSPLLEYVSEVIPTELFQSPKLAITLKPRSKDHWNTASDLILPDLQAEAREWGEAKQAVLCLEEVSAGAEVSPAPEFTPGESLPMEAEDKQAVLCLEEVSAGAEVSPAPEFTPGESLPMEAEDNGCWGYLRPCRHLLQTQHRLLGLTPFSSLSLQIREDKV